MRLNGRQTIYQMIQLADEVRKRGGTPLEPLAYKHRYHDLLMARIEGRLDGAGAGAAPTPEDWTVPGSHALLESLKRARRDAVPGQRHRPEVRPPARPSCSAGRRTSASTSTGPWTTTRTSPSR